MNFKILCTNEKQSLPRARALADSARITDSKSPITGRQIYHKLNIRDAQRPAHPPHCALDGLRLALGVHN